MEEFVHPPSQTEANQERQNNSALQAKLVQLRAELARVNASSEKMHTPERQVAMLQGALLLANQRNADLEGRIAQLNRQAFISERAFAERLQQLTQSARTFAAAFRDSDARVKLLLSSRFLRLGWFLGFGSTPQWAEPLADRLSAVRELLHGDPALAGQAWHAEGQRAWPVDEEMESALGHLRQKGFSPAVIVDVGAAKGYWSFTAGAFWPAAAVFMIDPLVENQTAAKGLCKEDRFHFIVSAIGTQAGEAVMNIHPDPDGSSLLPFPGNDPARQRTVAVRTLDQLIEPGEIPPPTLVKIDVQGYELNVLQGASAALKSAEVFIIECNLFEFMPGCPRLHEIVNFMAGRGFYPFDIAGFLRRPFQNDLGQVDVVFVRADSALVASNRWVEVADDAASPPAETLGGIPLLPPVIPPLQQTSFVSVVICTRDPSPGILNRTLEAIEGQSLAKDRFELVIVDNGSNPPLKMDALAVNRSMKMTLIVEEEPGLSVARCAGIAAARGDLLVFVDDDNFLAPEYLEQAMKIAAHESRIGLFGGIAEVELEAPIAGWKQMFLPYLGVRDYGPAPITAFSDHWGKWEPIGAGMVARRLVAEKFVQMHRASVHAQRLGRRGRALLSGEDSLFARAAHRVGYACSYQPALRLIHYIKASRLRLRYLARLLEGHGRSYVLMNRAIERPTENLKVRTAIARLGYRLKTSGRAGFVTWFWDLGYALEKRNELPDARETRLDGV